MTGISFRCPHCRRSVRVHQQLAGKQGGCPKCQGAVRVPETALGDKVVDVQSVPLSLLYTVQAAITGAAILWAPLLYDPQGMSHLLPFAWTLLAVVVVGLAALQVLAGAERLTVAEGGVVIGDQTVRWKDVVALGVSGPTSREHKAARLGDHTAVLCTKTEERHPIPRSYCLAADHHWIRVLDPRYRARLTAEVADALQARFGAQKTRNHRRLRARVRSAA